MNTNTIEWHKRCLANLESSLLIMQRMIDDKNEQARRLRDDITRLTDQITRAESEGRAKFDGTTFNRPRKKPHPAQPTRASS